MKEYKYRILEYLMLENLNDIFQSFIRKYISASPSPVETIPPNVVPELKTLYSNFYKMYQNALTGGEKNNFDYLNISESDFIKVAYPVYAYLKQNPNASWFSSFKEKLSQQLDMMLGLSRNLQKSRTLQDEVRDLILKHQESILVLTLKTIGAHNKEDLVTSFVLFSMLKEYMVR